MSRHIALLIILLFATLTLPGISEAQKKAKRRTVTTVVYVWEPTPGSAFFKFTRALPKVNKVEISQIAGREDQAEGESVFRKERVRIVSSKAVEGPDAEKFARIWRRQKQGAGNACFAPAFLLRFYSDDKLYFETILCFLCHNLMLSDDGEIGGFDAAGKEGQELLNAIRGLLPPMG